MYEKIRSHPRVREIWAKKLEEDGVVSRDEAEALVKQVRGRLMIAKDAPAPPASAPQNYPDAKEDQEGDTSPRTAIAADLLSALNEAISRVPLGFTVESKIARNFLEPRRGAMGNGTVNWAHAETLALASLLTEGTPVRLTGQDSERGTFTQRHLVLHDPTNGETYCPLQHLPDAKASFAVHNSPLSENAVLGFEYGYSVHATDTLVLWEAQYGDFANGAQVIIDQFISSGNAKWGQSPSVVLLLPHGYEGSGPEHSSARLERFLQLCAGDNLRVANCTTPAQYFHLLRRQAAQLKVEPRPLVVMTPKSLLRHPRVTSSLPDFAEGEFRPLLDDPREPARKAGVRRLILCSGKVYVDLVYGPAPQFAPREAYEQGDTVAIARVEELNPFPVEELSALLGTYPNLNEVVWVQEEPQNMGAWSFARDRIAALLHGGILLRYVGRPEAASPAEGSQASHEADQAYIINEAYAGVLMATVPPPARHVNGAHRTNGNGAKLKVPDTVPQTTSQKRTEAKTHAR
jgi:2-oxoglutarate dehydrogenase E1 component